MAGPSFLPDWRDGSAYQPLEAADQAVLCWEWLRRDPSYQRAAASRAPSDARNWGLHRFECPELGAGAARPIWTAARLPTVLHATAFRSAGADDETFFARALEGLVTAVSGRLQHVSLSNGFQAIRLDIAGRPIAHGPVRLHYRLQGMASLARSLAALDRFRMLATSGRFRPEPVSPAKRRRAVLLLRSWDALQSKASQREIASVLLCSNSDLADWRSSSPSLRSQAQRLVKGAQSLAAGRYWTLLG